MDGIKSRHRWELDRVCSLSQCPVEVAGSWTALWLHFLGLGSGWAQPDLWHCVGSVNGDVRFFDPRMPESMKVLQIVKGLTALDIHPQANLFAW